MKKRKIVYRALSVPLGSREVKFLKYGILQSFVRYSLFLFFEHVLLPRFDFVTVAAPEYAEILVRVGVDGGRVYVTPFYVEDEFFNQPLRTKVGKPFVFGYAGGFHFYHDLTPLVEAFQLLAEENVDAQLVFVGDGVSRPQTKREVMRRRISDKVRFLGRVPYASMPEILSKMDCFVLLTVASGLPIGLLEAAAAGKPIITVKKKEDAVLSRFFTHRNEIYTVKSLSPDEIAKAMKLLYNDSILRNTLAQKARKAAEQHFSQRIARKQLQELIQKLPGF